MFVLVLSHSWLLEVTYLPCQVALSFVKPTRVQQILLRFPVIGKWQSATVCLSQKFDDLS